MSAPELKQCPFCGGVAEQDYQQPYRSISAGNLGKACAIYCTTCSASMDLCHEDHGGVSPDDLMSELVAAWNARAADPALTAAQAEIARLTAERDAAIAGPVAWRMRAASLQDRFTDCRFVAEDMGKSGWTIDPLYTAQQPAPAPQTREITVQEAAEVLLSNDIAIACMAEGIHDGPLMADDHEFSAARPQGSWCVDAVRAALRALAATQKGG